MEKLAKENSFKIKQGGGCLQKNQKDADGNITLTLAKKIKITSDTYIFRFSFPNPDLTLGLPIGGHVIFSATIPTPTKPQGELVCRKYTPTSMIHCSGYVDFVIKIYRKNVAPRFPDGGIMTQYLESLEPGAKMLMEGPKGQLAYEGMGNFTIKRKPLNKKRIGMVSGGTGITPCYQVIQAALKGDDGTHLSLLFGSRTVEDILMKQELDQLALNYPERFSLFYTVDIAPEASTNWKYGTGFVTKEMLKSTMPEASEDTVILFCGPPIFEDMMIKHLKDMGYADSMMFKF